MSSGSSWIKTRVSSTASRTLSGRVSSCSLARRVSRSSGKPELAPDVVQAEQATRLHVFRALAKIGERLLVLKDVERLLDRVPLLRRDDHRRGTPLAGDDDVLVSCFDVVEQLGKSSAGIGERDDSRHMLSVQKTEQLARRVLPAGHNLNQTHALAGEPVAIGSTRRQRR